MLGVKLISINSERGLIKFAQRRDRDSATSLSRPIVQMRPARILGRLVIVNAVDISGAQERIRDTHYGQNYLYMRIVIKEGGHPLLVIVCLARPPSSPLLIGLWWLLLSEPRGCRTLLMGPAYMILCCHPAVLCLLLLQATLFHRNSLFS